MAKLQAVVDSLDSVPEALRGLYESRDGRYHFTGVEGFDPGYITQRNKLQKEVTDLKAAVKQYEELGDPASLAELKRAQAAAEEARQRSAGEFDKVLESTKKQIVTEWEKRTNEAVARAEKAESKVERILLDREAKYAVAAEGGVPEILLQEVRSRLKVVADENGEEHVVVLGKDGVPRTKADGSQLTIRELIVELKQDPIWRLGFPAGMRGGTGAPAHQLGTSAEAAQRAAVEKLPPAERIAALRKQGLVQTGIR